MSRYNIAQKILCAGYFWPFIFKDCIPAARSCHACQIYQQKMCVPPTPLHPVVTIDPFSKWGIDYMTYTPRSAGGHGYIIVFVDYFTKWAEANGQVEALNKVLVTILQRTIGMHKSNWHLMLFSTLWAYRTSTKDATGFTLFQLVYGMEATLPIECEIPSLKLVIKLLSNTTLVEECLLYLERLDETHRLASLIIEAQKKSKTHFDQTVHPHSFVKGDLVLLYDQVNDKLGASIFEPMWHGPYIVKSVLQKGVYELIDYEGNPLDKP
eukprot:PITA_33308